MSKARSKKYRAQLEKLSKELVDYKTAITQLKSLEGPKFDESIEISVNLGIDTKSGEQNVRGTVTLPRGSGKAVRVLVIAKGEDALAAKEAGADYVGEDDVIEKIKGGWMDFDKVIATPDMMKKVSQVARVLGPKGLMPNPKLGTVTPQVKQAVENQKKGAVEYRADKGGVIHSLIGKKSFSVEHLAENFEALMGAVQRSRPAAVKGDYIKRVFMSTTMSPSVEVKRTF